MFIAVKHYYPSQNRLNNNIQIPRLFHSFSTQNSFYVAHTVHRNLPLDLLQPDGVSVAMYKRKVSEWLDAETLIKSPYAYRHKHSHN